MNKSDLKLIAIVFIFSILGLIYLYVQSDVSNTAYIYYESEEILKIPLRLDETYVVDGFNGDVTVEVSENRIRVVEEVSPLNLCSKQGYIKYDYETIVCLPNKIVIKIGDDSEYDTIVR